MNGWKDAEDIKPYESFRNELTVTDGIIFKGMRVVVPEIMTQEMLLKIHSAHLGVDSCLRRARESSYWPGMNNDIREFVSKCDTCSQYVCAQQKETLMPHDVQDRPWQRVGTDLFTWR